MSTIQAAVVTAAGAPPVVGPVELVEPEHDEALIRIAATGICHTDLSCASGVLPSAYPVVLGHEAAGVVERVGPTVESLREGDRVVVSAVHHCGHCRWCESGYAPLCARRSALRPRYLSTAGEPMTQAFGTGTFAEATVLRERSLVKVPDDVPLEVAAVTGCAVITGMGAVANTARVAPGAAVAVFGCGAVGMSIVMGSALAGAERVTAVDPDPQRRALAMRLGATDAQEPDDAALRAGQPGGYDYVFESAGRVEAMSMAVEVAGPTGIVTLLGLPGTSARLSLDVIDLIGSGKTLIGCNMGQVRPHVDFHRWFGLYRRGRLPLDALVGSRRPLADAADAFAEAAAGGGIRVVLTGGAQR